MNAVHRFHAGADRAEPADRGVDGASRAEVCTEPHRAPKKCVFIYYVLTLETGVFAGNIAAAFYNDSA